MTPETSDDEDEITAISHLFSDPSKVIGDPSSSRPIEAVRYGAQFSKAFDHFTSNCQACIDQYKCNRQHMISVYGIANTDNAFLVSHIWSQEVSRSGDKSPIELLLKFYAARLVEHHKLSGITGSELENRTQDDFRQSFPACACYLLAQEDSLSPLEVVPETFYGSLLAHIREADKAMVEEVWPGPLSGQVRCPLRRIFKELTSVHDDTSLPYISVAPIDGCIDNCLASMEGAPGTPYAGGVFWLHIEYPKEYPMKPAFVTFLTPVYHPNIDSKGQVCIDVLEDSWSPCLTTEKLLLSILSILHHPILDDPLMPDIAQQYLLDYDDFCDIARLHTQESANGLRPDTSHLINHLTSPLSLSDLPEKARLPSTLLKSPAANWEFAT